MPFYFRKSIKLGPVRFNFSKSGIGVSTGVKGFRYGVRPNGRSYIHAGRYGVYYRKELGGVEERKSHEVEASEYQPTLSFDSENASNIATVNRKEIAELISASLSGVRYDYLSGSLGLILSVISYYIGLKVGITVSTLSIFATLYIGLWENRRRTIYVNYYFTEHSSSIFKQVILAFNSLTDCEKVWFSKSAETLHNTQDIKNHAGATTLLDREAVKIGQGTPPWIKANVPIPTIIAKNQTIFFLPDCLIIHDRSGIAALGYEELEVHSDTAKFVEDFPPRDAEIIDTTWQHPNKSGGPDKRYSSNREIAVCLFGEILLTSKSGFLLFLQTSQAITSDVFRESMNRIQTALRIDSNSRSDGVIRPWIEVHPERYQPFSQTVRMSGNQGWKTVKEIAAQTDAKLKFSLGEDNEILQKILRPMIWSMATLISLVVGYILVHFLIYI